MSLFDMAAGNIPLAERMRPENPDEFVGQEKIFGPDSLLRRAISEDNLSSLIFWGPPGSGKTTLANVIAKTTKRKYVSLSAVSCSIKEARIVMEKAKQRRLTEGRGTILFVDEIHRFNKAQQDAFLPFVEKGTIVLIGATTENPSFAIINALLSRCRVYVLEALTDRQIGILVDRALENNERGLADFSPQLQTDARELLINYVNGDARAALNTLELAVISIKPNPNGKRILSKSIIAEALEGRLSLYDKSGEEHYNLISALHKSLRGSDPQAALYWFTRMLHCGEDPMYLARRLVRFASEDIGLADPQALPQAIAARDAYHFLGIPEGDCALAQCVIYLATAPKSNRVYTALKAARKDVKETRNEPVPMHIRNAPTKLMAELGYSKGYNYDHNCKDGFSGQSFLPANLSGKKYYQPGPYGFEKEIKKRLAYWERLRQEKSS